MRFQFEVVFPFSSINTYFITFYEREVVLRRRHFGAAWRREHRKFFSGKIFRGVGEEATERFLLKIMRIVEADVGSHIGAALGFENFSLDMEMVVLKLVEHPFFVRDKRWIVSCFFASHDVAL